MMPSERRTVLTRPNVSSTTTGTHLKLDSSMSTSSQALSLDLALHSFKTVSDHDLQFLPLPCSLLLCDFTYATFRVPHLPRHSVSSFQPPSEHAEIRHELVLGIFKLLKKRHDSRGAMQHMLGQPLQCIRRVLKSRKSRPAHQRVGKRFRRYARLHGRRSRSASTRKRRSGYTSR